VTFLLQFGETARPIIYPQESRLVPGCLFFRFSKAGSTLAVSCGRVSRFLLVSPASPSIFLSIVTPPSVWWRPPHVLVECWRSVPLFTPAFLHHSPLSPEAPLRSISIRHYSALSFLCQSRRSLTRPRRESALADPHRFQVLKKRRPSPHKFLRPALPVSPGAITSPFCSEEFQPFAFPPAINGVFSPHYWQSFLFVSWTKVFLLGPRSDFTIHANDSTWGTVLPPRDLVTYHRRLFRRNLRSQDAETPGLFPSPRDGPGWDFLIPPSWSHEACSFLIPPFSGCSASIGLGYVPKRRAVIGPFEVDSQPRLYSREVSAHQPSTCLWMQLRLPF